MSDAAVKEMSEFKDAKLWEDGFIDADPLKPLSWSSYSSNGFVSIYHAVYLAAIHPYLAKGDVVLEIGPGRGAWTRALFEAGAAFVYALDVQSREHNAIDKFIGESNSQKLNYFEVNDFLCSGIPDDSIDFFWSFGTFVHLSRDAQSAYFQNIFSKLKSGAHGFIQYADLDAWNKVVGSPDLRIHDVIAQIVGGEAGEKLRANLDANDRIAAREPIAEYVRNYDVVNPGRYFYVGQDWIVSALKECGFEVISPSLFPSLRDPLIHFKKSA